MILRRFFIQLFGTIFFLCGWTAECCGQTFDIYDEFGFEQIVYSGKMGNSFAGDTIVIHNTIDATRIPLFEPIGTLARPFRGTVIGKTFYEGKPNIFIKIDKKESDYVGLFGVTSGATIKNISVCGRVYGRDYVGGVVGFAHKTNFVNCSNYAEVRGINNVGCITGGCCGGSIAMCSENSNVFGVSNVGPIYGKSALTHRNLFMSGGWTCLQGFSSCGRLHLIR